MSPAGATLGFIGLTFTDRTCHQHSSARAIYTPWLSSHGRQASNNGRPIFCRAKKATGKLRQYYKYDLPKLEALGSAFESDARLPCYSLYHDLAGSMEHSIRYSSRQADILWWIRWNQGVHQVRHQIFEGDTYMVLFHGYRAEIKSIQGSTWRVIHGSYGSDWRCVHVFVHLGVQSHLWVMRFSPQGGDPSSSSRMCPLLPISWPGQMVDQHSCWCILIGQGKLESMLSYECEYRPSAGASSWCIRWKGHQNWPRYGDAPDNLWGIQGWMNWVCSLKLSFCLYSDSCLCHSPKNKHIFFRIDV